MMDAPLLCVRNLSVTYPGDDGDFKAVRNVSFTLGRERLGIVGESGSGKSTTGRAIMGLARPPARVAADALVLGDIDLRSQSERQLRRLRGKRMAMVLQDPKYSLDPVMSVGQQIAETHRTHLNSSKAEAKLAALEMLNAVHIRDPERVYAMYPHQVSGGMGQRIMIAMMLIAGPELLIADEPTSALDVTVQSQVLSIMDELVRERGMGLILISHNLHLVSSFCDRVLVMYAGQIVEICDAGRLADAQHPYTRGLLAALPELGRRREELPQLQRDPAWMDDIVTPLETTSGKGGA
ncbi:MAG: ABC transporter ATP-binding protein [Aquabacterium sp.]